MRFLSLLALLALSACAHLSPACQAAMDECLKKCPPEGPQQRSDWIASSMTPCERTCHVHFDSCK
jgi:hypothetical protein